MSDQEITVVDPVSADEAVETSPEQVETAPTAVENTDAVSSDTTEAPADSDEVTETAPTDEGVSIHNLQIGQRLTGKVKNLAEFGAFVDIGIAQDGLVHISELAKQKVEKVTDVVSQGQEIEVWVK